MLPNKSLSKTFAPNSIAIYGVSQDTRKVGSTILANLQRGGFTGKIFPINPNYQELFGYTCYPKASVIPHRVDLAVMAIPGQFYKQVLEDCNQKKIKNLVIISAGFSEVGEEGKAMEDDIKKLADKYEIDVLGPNCLGLLVSSSNLNLSFAANDIYPGDIAFFSQSGAVCTALLDMAQVSHLGFSHFVSIGNKVDINENDLLPYWLQSNKVKVIGGYLEEFDDGYDFITAKAKLKVEKPIVLLKPGKSEQAAEAITSHTGSLAGSDDVISAALEKHGITRVSDLDEMHSTLMAFSWFNHLEGNRVAILTNAGGPGIIGTDLVESSGLELATLSADTKRRLAKVLPPTANTHNPIDVVGDALADRYLNALLILEEEKNVDTIVLILTPQLVTQIEDTAKGVISFVKNYKKPVIPVFIGGEYVNAGIARLFDNKVPVFTNLTEAISALAKVCKYNEYLARHSKFINVKKIVERRKPNLVKDLSSATILPEIDAKGLMEEFEIDYIDTEVVHTLEEAEAAATKIGYPIVIKASVEQVVHKTDFKAIFTNIHDKKELKEALTQLQENIYKKTKVDHPPVVLQKQAQSGLELFVGIKRDGGVNVYEDGVGFGHLLLFGTGGIYTEVYQDIANILLPATVDELLSAIKSTKAYRIINGERGLPELHLQKLIAQLRNIQTMVLTYPEIKEMDVNPLILTEKSATIVDAKIFVG
jgi:acetyl coenzyme A synthetase (ADP forming)-like protein